MPNLSELTDYDPSPVQQPYAGPRLVVTPSNASPDTDQLPVDIRPEPLPEPMPALSDFNTTVGTKVDNILNKLTGSNGQERYQLWPEKVVRSGLSAAHDVMTEGTLPPGLRREDFTDIPAPTMPTNDSTWLGKALGIAPVAADPNDSLIEKAQDIAALAGTGGAAGTGEGATLGSSPFLRPALKYEGKIYKAPIKDAENPLGFGAEHSDALPTHLADDFYKKAMSGEDINHYQFGFMNEKGQFLDREKALNHGINTGLVDPQNGKYGVLTSTMLADSSKPGTAIEAMAKTKPMESLIARKNYNPELVKDTEVLKNPSNRDFLKLLKESAEGKAKGEVRTLTDKDGNLHIWNANDATHQGVIDSLKLKMNHDEDWGNHLVKIGDKIIPSGNPKPMTGNPDWLNKYLKGKELFSDSSKEASALQANKPTFYSSVEHNVNNISQAKMNGDQWLATLSNKPGVKPEELQWSGLKDFLEENKGKPVTKEQVQEHLQNNKVELKEVDKGAEVNKLRKAKAQELMAKLNELEKDNIAKGTFKNTPEMDKIQNELQAVREQSQAVTTKYHSYQLPGATNYREKLLTLPPKLDTRTPLQTAKDIFNKPDLKTIYNLEPEQIKILQKELDKQLNKVDSQYKSSHWDESNILAHVRMNDRMIDGKKSLGINEAQSDWHQQGRKTGYAPTEAEKTAASDKIKEIRQQQQDLLKSRITKTSDGKYAVKMDNGETIRFNDQQSAMQVAMMPTGDVRPKWIELDDKAAELGKIASNMERKVPDAPFKKTWHELVLKRMIREASEKGYDNLHFPGSPETVAKVEGWSNFKTKTVDGEKRYFTGDQDVTPIINRYLVDFPRFLNKIGKDHGAKVSSLEIPGKLSNKMGEPPEIIKLNHMDIPESLKNTAMHKGFPLFSNKYMFVPVQGDPFADKK